MQITLEKIVSLYGEAQIEIRVVNEQLQHTLKELATVREELKKATLTSKPRTAKPS